MHCACARRGRWRADTTDFRCRAGDRGARQCAGRSRDPGRQLRELVAAEASRPFSLDSGPVLRAWITSWVPISTHWWCWYITSPLTVGVSLLLDDSRGIQQRWQHIACRILSEYAKTHGPSGRSRRKGSTTGVSCSRGATMALHTDHPRPNVLSYQARCCGDRWIPT